MDHSNISKQIKDICRAIKNLMPRYHNNWVPWRQVSKEVYGTEEYVDSVIAYTQLKDFKKFFIKANYVVKLSEEGFNFLRNQSHHTPIKQTQVIANAVRDYAKSLRPIIIDVIGISRVANVDNKYVTEVKIDIIDAVLPSETPVEFIPQMESKTHGVIVGQEPEGGILYIAFDSNLYESSLPAKLKIDRSYLLVKLAEQLSKLDKLPELINLIFKINDNFNHVSNVDSKLVARQLASLSIPWARFLWGPPGSGKTFAIAELIYQILIKNPSSRILVVAPSNRAVDVVLVEIVERLKNTKLYNLILNRKILRYGYPRIDYIMNMPELLGPVELEKHSKEVKEFSRLLKKAERENRSSDELAILKTKLLAKQEFIKKLVEFHIKQCNVVASTVTLSYLHSSPISSQKWDAVFIDEATMVTPAMATFLASLSDKRFLLSGDPRQLGPIFESSKENSGYEWMGKDIFEKARISFGSGIQRHISEVDPRLSRILSQRRCVNQIWVKVSSLYKNVENLVDIEKHQSIIDLPPVGGNSVVLMNTSSELSSSRCEKMGNSWSNKFHSELAIELINTIASEYIPSGNRKLSIAIISPYRAQVKIIRNLLREEKKAIDYPYNYIDVDVGTIHQFQGSAADIIIFDMVDSFPRNRLGILLRGDNGIRLVNVAITRAKAKLIVLADKLWAASHGVKYDNPLLWSLLTNPNDREILKVLPPSVDDEPSFKVGRELCESPIEEKLFDAILKHPELKNIEPQHRIYDKSGKIVSRADFAFPDKKLAIYCDSKKWHLRDENVWQKDIRQRNKLTELGWQFLIFTGREINHDSSKCASQILETYLKK